MKKTNTDLKKNAKNAIALARMANERASRYEYGYYHPVYNLMHPDEVEGKLHTEFIDKNKQPLYLGDSVKYCIKEKNGHAGAEGRGIIVFKYGAFGLAFEDIKLGHNFLTFSELMDLDMISNHHEGSSCEQLLCVEKA